MVCDFMVCDFELHVSRLEGQRAVACVERGQLLDREFGDHLVEDVVLVHGKDAEPPAGAAEVLRRGR
jgi:hypothetical protein